MKKGEQIIEKTVKDISKQLGDVLLDFYNGKSTKTKVESITKGIANSIKILIDQIAENKKTL